MDGPLDSGMARRMSGEHGGGVMKAGLSAWSTGFLVSSFSCIVHDRRTHRRIYPLCLLPFVDI